MSKKFQVSISDIHISPNLDEDMILTLLSLWNPSLAEASLEVHWLDTGAGPQDWDRNRVHKSLCVLSHDDLVPALYEQDAVYEYLRPYVVIDDSAEDGFIKATLLLRDLVYTGQKGHDHATYHPTDPARTDGFEDVELLPGTLDTLTPDEVKHQYDRF